MKKAVRICASLILGTLASAGVVLSVLIVKEIVEQFWCVVWAELASLPPVAMASIAVMTAMTGAILGGAIYACWLRK